MRVLTKALPLMLILCVFGCETSKSFQAAIEKSGPVAASRAEGYLANDASLDESTKAQREAQVAALRVASTPPVRFRNVYESWRGIRSWFGSYSASDPALTGNPAKQMAREALIQSTDQLVEAERRRRAIWFPWDNPAPLP